ncbi:BTAD domain-containing putative transcriptional regulator [Streptomyces sp. NPDC051286]|uniref:BTAD domain-containing putative transcriptional regulator n=1 Tax=Streptomyces sp. NPDC051286 TaxID=3365647 RepID=UPI0037A243C6
MRYLILGVTEARDEHGGMLPVGGTRLRALLAALALRKGRPVPVADLVDDVWAGDPPYDASAALQALVGRLRRALDRGAVTSTPGGYRLAAAPDDIDLHVFEQLSQRGAAELESGDPEAAAATLRTALALWRGPALADLPERDHGRRPEAHRLTTLERRIEADLRRGGALTPVALVPELTELTTAHPYDERFRAQLIRALCAEGRQADALTAYEEARRALADGLGADPGSELRALHQELLAATEPTAAAVRGVVGAPANGHPHPPEPAPPRGNLRPRLTSFVGREPELRAIRADLAGSRLVTLTGPGGSGKTRLAEESAHAVRATVPVPGTDAWIAELAPVEDPAGVPGAVLTALGLRETNLLLDSGRDGQPLRSDPTELLVEYLAHRTRPGSRPFLLILDNCEHVIDAAAALAETLLTRCPHLRILATSREPLGVPGESVRPVGPLPADRAHRLFAERARAVRPDFDPEPGSQRDAVAEICRRLDGLPLAIELAAARLRMLGPRQIADRLDDRFRLLTGGSRTVLPRQQTLRAVVDWSWDLLDDAERTALRQVSVFAGGWDLTAAEAVITASLEATVADLIGALVDKSLVVAAPTPTGEMRYRLLETIHEYATERAAETPETLAAAESAHTAYVTALVEEAEPRLRSGEQLPWIQRMETDLDNIRAALTRTTVAHVCEADATRLVLRTGWFWWLRNLRSEGLAWTERALSLGNDPTDPTDPRYWPRMELRMLQFFLAVESRAPDDVSDDDRFQELVRTVRDAFSAPGPHSARFPGLLWPMTSYLSREPGDIRNMFDAALANTRLHGGAWEYGVMLMFRTHLIVDMPGGMPGVDEDLAELRVLARSNGDRWMRAQSASAAAEAGMMRGRYEEARAAYEEALLLAREVGAHAEAPFLLARLADLAYRTGDTAAAERGLDESAAEAERYQVHDARAYVQCLRGIIALDRGEIPEARRQVTEAQRSVGRGNPPVHFLAVIDGLSARIAAREPESRGGGPAVGVRGLTGALRMAWDAQCAEGVTGFLAQSAALLLPAVGFTAAGVRVLAAAGTWRLPGSLTWRERAEAEELRRQACEELGRQLYESELAAGTPLTVDDVLELLTRITAELPGAEGSGSDRRIGSDGNGPGPRISGS